MSACQGLGGWECEKDSPGWDVFFRRLGHLDLSGCHGHMCLEWTEGDWWYILYEMETVHLFPMSMLQNAPTLPVPSKILPSGRSSRFRQESLEEEGGDGPLSCSF